MPALETQMGTCPACKADNVKLIDVQGLFICEKCSSKRFSNKVRKNIQEAYERQQEIKRRQIWKKRIEIAKRGVAKYEKGDVQEALNAFSDYLGILEHRYGVGRGALHPNLFKKEEAGEILLIAGVYWDLSKIYDRAKNQQSEMRACLNKFVEFSIDRPHLILASEAMRKYIGSEKIVNKQDFNNAHTLMRSKLTKCFIATAVFEAEAPEILALREFRDSVLVHNRAGRAFIRAYYRVSPPIAAKLVNSPRASAVLRFGLKRVAYLITVPMRPGRK